MEDLNKTQIVLLAIFITFVTSAATGVIVVTLMDQAPQGITQTINRVVERTVETVVSPGKIERTEIKQIVKEDDTIVSSIKKIRQSLVIITREDGGGIASENIKTSPLEVLQQASIFNAIQSTEQDLGSDVALNNKIAASTGRVAGIGFWISGDGIILTTSDILGGVDSKYFIVLNNGAKTPLAFLKSDKTRGVALLKLDASEEDKVSITPINGLLRDGVSLGQTVISLGIESGEDTVSIGYISGLKDTTIKTSLEPSYNWGGRPIVDINGFLIGIYNSNKEIIPYNAIRSLVDSLSTVPKTATTTDSQ